MLTDTLRKQIKSLAERGLTRPRIGVFADCTDRSMPIVESSSEVLREEGLGIGKRAGVRLGPLRVPGVARVL